MNITTRKSLLASSIAALIFSGNVAAASQNPGDPEGQTGAPESSESDVDSVRTLQEVVVTARRRAESLDDVPVAVTAIDRQILENSIASDFTKVGELAPQVSMSQGGSGTGAIITVRGVSSASNDSGLEQSVAIEFDGVPMSRGQIMSSAIFDVDQIQVLQGPQALFFGKNSPAGVISLNSADPTDSFEGYLTGGYEFETDQVFLEGAVSGPLTETLKARLAVRASEREGWIRNVAEPVQDFINPEITVPGATAGSRGPNDEIKAARLTLLWDPTDDFTAKLKLMVNSQYRNGGNASTEPFCVGGLEVPVLAGGIVIPGADCDRNMRKAHSSVAPEYAVNFPNGNGGVPYFDSDYTFGSLALSKRWGDLELVSTTGYFDQTVKALSVSDWSSFATIFSTDAHSDELFTQEFRLSSDYGGPVNFMTGLYYETFKRGFENAADLFHVFNPVSQNYAAAHIDAKTDGDSFSAFGQISWDISPTVELAGGARYSRDKKSADLVNVATGPGMPTLRPVGDVLTSRYSDSNVSPEATLSWRPTEDQTFYAAYKTGYKSGGISVPFFMFDNATPENQQFEAEEAKGFEVGYKATALDRRLRFDVAAYSYDYENLQVVTYNSETISFKVSNAASARIEGVQGSFQWLAADSLSLRGNMGYNRARYDSFNDAQCYAGQTVELGCVDGTQDLSGFDLLRAPRLTYSLGADYNPELIDGWSTAFSLQATYSGSFETSADYSPAGHQDSYWLLNASVRLAPVSWRYEIALIGRNLTNSYYMLQSNGWSGAGDPRQHIGWFNPPREVAIQATVRF